MEKDELIIFCDGGARGNPGPAGAGIVIKSSKKTVKFRKFLGEKTNNQAEYEAILLALKKIEDEFPHIKTIEFYLDSELAVKQLRGDYKIKNESLGKSLISIRNLIIVRDLLVDFKHISREKNKEADKLVNRAIDEGLAE